MGARIRAMSRGNHYSYDEYRVLEQHSGIKHEYVAGEIYAMAGGTPGHARLAAAVIAQLRPQLQGCSVYTSDLRIRIVETDLATYPDVSVICGPPQLVAGDQEAVVNPIVVVEVTSRSTERYDRGVKLAHYQLLPSLQEILLVSHREPRVTLYRRDGPGWTEGDYRAGQAVDLRSVSARLAVDDVYRDGLDVLL
jgi:Uma2 family endonuclease